MERWRKGIQLKDAQTNKNTQNELKIEKNLKYVKVRYVHVKQYKNNFRQEK